MASQQLIQEIIASIPGAQLVADNRQILCRCPKCGDSPNPANAHFYIGPLRDESKPLQYNCKKCESSGIFDSQLMRELSIYDYELLAQINEYNQKIANTHAGEYSYSKSTHILNNTKVTESAISEVKLRYINDRLGLSLTYADILANKIVLNISDIFEQNRIPEFTRHPNIMAELDKYFIGFISYDNCYLNMRRLCPEGKVYSGIDKRYINYNIFNKIDNSMRFYVLPTSIDILDVRPIHVYITEGPFDILSVKYNIPEYDKCIHISVGGKSYLTAIKFIIETLGIINMVLHLCPDGDVDDWQMYNIAKYLAPFNLPIDMRRNVMPKEKDFGVPLSNIDMAITNLNKIYF